MRFWTLLVSGLVACGGGGGGGVDSAAAIDGPGTIDASGDGGAPDADGQRVSVTVYTLDWRMLDPTAIAIFAGPDGTVIQHGPVDAMGEAAAVVPDGSTLTVLQKVVEDTTHTAFLTTIRGVRAGEHYTINGRFTYNLVSSMIGLVTPPPGQTAYVLTPCDTSSAQDPGNGQPHEAYLEFFTGCLTDTFEAFALSDNLATGERQYLAQDGITYSPTGTFSLTGAWQTAPTSTVTIASVPPGLAGLTWSFCTRLGWQAWGIDYRQVPSPSPGTHTGTFRYPGTTGTGTLLLATTSGTIAPYDLDKVARFRTGPPQPTELLDFDARPVPIATAPVQTPGGATWTEVAAGAPDARLIEWRARWIEGPRTHHAYWHLVEDPSSGASTTLPGLPAAYADDDPTIVDAAALEPQGVEIDYIDYSNLDGYEVARPLGYHLRAFENHFLDVDHDVRFSRSR